VLTQANENFSGAGLSTFKRKRLAINQAFKHLVWEMVPGGPDIGKLLHGADPRSRSCVIDYKKGTMTSLGDTGWKAHDINTGELIGPGEEPSWRREARERILSEQRR
jgi:hypothetical protein